MNNIYLFQNAIKNIGRTPFPQHHKLPEDYDSKSPRSIYALRGADKFPDFELDLPVVLLTKGVKLTDLISSAPFSWHKLIVSQKLLKLLAAHKLPPHKIYPLTVKHGEEIIKDEYSLLYLLEPKEDYDRVDYEGSKFWISEYISHKNLERIDLKSYEDYLAKREDLKRVNENKAKGEMSKTIFAEEIKLKPGFLESHDLFSLASFTFPISFKVTQKLKDVLEEERITGLRLTRISGDREELEISSYYKKTDYTLYG